MEKSEEKAAHSPAQAQAPYTAFSKSRKWYLTGLLGYLTLASSLTATIYFPLIPLLSQQYVVSIPGHQPHYHSLRRLQRDSAVLLLTAV